jgi:hypothetical protein
MLFLIIYGIACASIGACLGVVVLAICRIAADKTLSSEPPSRFRP